MRKPYFTLGAWSLVLVLAGAGNAAEREMNVKQGPETVFGRSPAEILPALAGAKATGENGRVGTELAFWGYELANGGRVFFFGCAPSVDVDCGERVQAICPANVATVLETQQATGTIVQRSCRSVVVAGPGDLRPGCEDLKTSADLLVGLVSCG
jgi:hypothetical protein